MRTIWTQCTHVFSIGNHNRFLPPDLQAPVVFQRPDRMDWSKLSTTVDVTFLQGMLKLPPDSSPDWLCHLWTKGTLPSSLAILIDDGPSITHSTYHLWLKFLQKQGFSTHCWSSCDSECGASCRREITITLIWNSDVHLLDLPVKLGHSLPPRPSTNTLRDFDLPPHKFRPPSFCRPCHPKQPHLPGQVGLTPQGQPIYSSTTTLPASSTVWIKLPRGCRLVEPRELQAMKGLPTPTSWPTPLHQYVPSQPSVHLWSVLGDLLQTCSYPSSPLPSTVCPPPLPSIRPPPLPEAAPSWTWSPPDLSEGSLWHQTCTARLHQAAAFYPNPTSIIQEGQALLDAHRLNYGPDGPVSLVNLWWEWPPDQWEDLRLGTSLNFLQTPPPACLPNYEMSDAERIIGGQFVDELISLGVLEAVPPHDPNLNTCPLFLVPKPGQPGQYRCIADMKRGGQNTCCGADPCHMTSPSDILPHIYTHGFSAVIDLAKYFHMFLTLPEERRFMGVCHPCTGLHYRYCRLPMGASNSPAASGRFGAALLRLILTTIPEFTGAPVLNGCVASFLGHGSHPTGGTGRILLDQTGSLACQAWLHVDDLLIHGPSYEKLCAALTKLFDLLLRLGLICNPTKITPPSQIVKYCGFLYDTTHFPLLQIPETKISKAVAIIDYVTRASSRPLSRYALATVTGSLQSLIPATPNAIGASFLTPLYDCLHDVSVADFNHQHVLFFSSPVTLSPAALTSLQWWRSALLSGLQNQLWYTSYGHLGVSWGDGSGAGMGGTIEWCDASTGPLPNITVWMGTWAPQIHSFSSNWRELRTVLASLDRIPPPQLHQQVLYYFTDNIVTYHAFRKGTSPSPPLRDLIQTIKLRELQYHCRVETVHIPGTAMIRQGSDGLSRGLWLTNLSDTTTNFTARLFRPAPITPALICWALTQLCDLHPTQWPSHLLHDTSPWTSDLLLGQHCLWSLSPTTARQGFTAGVLAWIQRPWESSHIFIVPRLLQRDFGAVNKNIIFCGQHDSLPLPSDFDPLVPFLLFYLPPFIRTLPPMANQRMDASSLLSCPDWVNAQMAELRGL
jgi:hypothetical protein